RWERRIPLGDQRLRSTMGSLSNGLNRSSSRNGRATRVAMSVTRRATTPSVWRNWRPERRSGATNSRAETSRRPRLWSIPATPTPVDYSCIRWPPKLAATFSIRAVGNSGPRTTRRGGLLPDGLAERSSAVMRGSSRRLHTIGGNERINSFRHLANRNDRHHFSFLGVDRRD